MVRRRGSILLQALGDRPFLRSGVENFDDVLGDGASIRCPCVVEAPVLKTD